ERRDHLDGSEWQDRKNGFKADGESRTQTGQEKMTGWIFRLFPLTTLIWLCAITAFASEIREFDLKTLERLGNELTRVSQTPERGATTPERKRAKQTAIAALKGKLYDIHYDYVVLDDPKGSGFLVYALGKGS